MNQSQQQVAIVTGASRGIGAAIATRLSADGFAVVINYASRAAGAEALAASLNAAGGRAIAVQADVAYADQVRRLFDATEARLGKVDVLVNNAGILKMGPLDDSSDVLFDEQFAINTKGSFNTMREAAGRIRDGGRIVNLSSTLVALNLPGYGMYTATKAAVEALTQVFSKELRGRQVTVNAVAPGPVATELFKEGRTAEDIAAFAKMAPLERLGEPDDIARVVAFLAGPDGGWINGQILRANGGLA